jgi:hypothetical protein
VNENELAVINWACGIAKGAGFAESETGKCVAAILGAIAYIDSLPPYAAKDLMSNAVSAIECINPNAALNIQTAAMELTHRAEEER